MSIASSTTFDEELELNPSGKRVIRATMHILLKLESLEPVDGFPRTKVEYFAQEDLAGGYIFKLCVNRKICKLLRHVSVMRLAFDKSLEIDQTSRDAMVLAMQLERHYSEKEMSRLMRVWIDFGCLMIFLIGPTLKLHLH